LSLAGSLTLAPFFTLGILVRVFVGVLCITPSLGLFNTSYHSYFGSLPVYSAASQKTYDIVNGTIQTFIDAWSPFSLRHSDFFHLPLTLLILFPVLLFLNITTTYMLQSMLHTQNKEIKIKRVFEALYSLLCPPLFFDWELLFRESNEALTITQCWTRSKFMVLANIMMHFVEHIVLCIPLMLMKSAIAKRESQLEDHFHPLGDELYSKYMVNILLTAGMLTSTVLPFFQCTLAYVYFRVGHPWSRILNAHL
jgi:hypothetical protein